MTDADGWVKIITALSAAVVTIIGVGAAAWLNIKSKLSSMATEGTRERAEQTAMLNANTKQLDGKLTALVEARQAVGHAEGKEAGVAQEQHRITSENQKTIDAARELVEHAADTAAAVIATAQQEAKTAINDAKTSAKEIVEDAKNAAKEIIVIAQKQPGSEGPMKDAAEATTQAAAATTKAAEAVSDSIGKIAEQFSPKPSPGKKV